MVAIGMLLLGVGGLIAKNRGGPGTFLAYRPIQPLVVALPVAGLALGLGLLGVLVYRRL
jgi:hypothetical protein